MNQRERHLQEHGLLSGAAVERRRQGEGSMGVDAGDFDNDGDEDLFITHCRRRATISTSTTAPGFSRTRSAVPAWDRCRAWDTPVSARPGSTSTTTAGLICCGERRDRGAAKGRANERFPYDERKLLFRNLDDGRFENVTRASGSGLPAVRSQPRRRVRRHRQRRRHRRRHQQHHRAGPLLINNVGNHQLDWPSADRLARRAPFRDMVGARLRSFDSAGRRSGGGRAPTEATHRETTRASLVGLGESTDPPTVRVFWPNGVVEQFPPVTVDRWTVLKQGDGRAP